MISYYDGELESLMEKCYDEAIYKNGEIISLTGEHYDLNIKISDYDLDWNPLYINEIVLYLYQH